MTVHHKYVMLFISSCVLYIYHTTILSTIESHLTTHGFLRFILAVQHFNCYNLFVRHIKYIMFSSFT